MNTTNDTPAPRLRLSPEAFQLIGVPMTVDLGLLLALEREQRPAIKKAAHRWGVQPEKILVSRMADHAATSLVAIPQSDGWA